jgi:hypothetical protein
LFVSVWTLTHAPEQQVALDDSQSLFVTQDARQDAVSLHTTPPGQAAGVPAEQVPDPLQAAGVN